MASKNKNTKKHSKLLKRRVSTSWLFLGGATVVVILGFVLVRISGAATIWKPISVWSGSWTVKYKQTKLAQTVTMTRGYKYRLCFEGYSTGSTISVKIPAVKSFIYAGPKLRTYCSREITPSKTGAKLTNGVYNEGSYATNPALVVKRFYVLRSYY